MRIAYLGPKKENSIDPNIEYFTLHVDENGVAKSGSLTLVFSEKYAVGEWKLLSISLPIENNGNRNFGNSPNDMSNGDFFLHKYYSGTPLIDTTFKVEKRNIRQVILYLLL